MIVVIILPNTMALDDVASLMKEADEEAKKRGPPSSEGIRNFPIVTIIP